MKIHGFQPLRWRTGKKQRSPKTHLQRQGRRNAPHTCAVGAGETTKSTLFETFVLLKVSRECTVDVKLLTPPPHAHTRATSLLYTIKRILQPEAKR